MNIKRITDYVDRLVLLPRKEGQPKKGNNGVLSDATETENLVQNTEKYVLGRPTTSLRDKSVKITKEMNEFRAYS